MEGHKMWHSSSVGRSCTAVALQNDPVVYHCSNPYEKTNYSHYNNKSLYNRNTVAFTGINSIVTHAQYNIERKELHNHYKALITSQSSICSQHKIALM